MSRHENTSLLLTSLYSSHRFFRHDWFIPQRNLLKRSRSGEAASDYSSRRHKKIIEKSAVHYSNRLLRQSWQSFFWKLRTSRLFRKHEFQSKSSFNRQSIFSCLRIWIEYLSLRRKLHEKAFLAAQVNHLKPLLKSVIQWKRRALIGKAKAHVLRKKYLIPSFNRWFSVMAVKQKARSLLLVMVPILSKSHLRSHFHRWTEAIITERKITQFHHMRKKLALQTGWKRLFGYFHLSVKRQQQEWIRQAKSEFLHRQLINLLVKLRFHHDHRKRTNKLNAKARKHYEAYQKLSTLQHLQHWKRINTAMFYSRYRSFLRVIECFRRNAQFYQVFIRQHLKKKVSSYRVKRGWKVWRSYLQRRLFQRQNFHQRHRHRFFRILQLKSWVVQQAMIVKPKTEGKTIDSIVESVEAKRGIEQLAKTKPQRGGLKNRILQKMSRYHHLHQHEQQTKVLQKGDEESQGVNDSSSMLRSSQMVQSSSSEISTNSSSRSKFYLAHERRFLTFYDFYALKQRLFFAFLRLRLYRKVKKKSRDYYHWISGYQRKRQQLHKYLHKLLMRRTIRLRRQRNAVVLQELFQRQMLLCSMMKLHLYCVKRWKCQQEDRLALLQGRNKTLQKVFTRLNLRSRIYYPSLVVEQVESKEDKEEAEVVEPVAVLPLSNNSPINRTPPKSSLCHQWENILPEVPANGDLPTSSQLSASDFLLF